MGHQVNTLFLFDCSKEKERETETRGERERERDSERERTRRGMLEKETTDFGRAVATSLCIKSKDKVIRQH